VFALLAAIVGEFMGSKEGLGTLILYANGNLDTARVFSILLVLAATGLSLHGLIGALRRRLLFWDAAPTKPIPPPTDEPDQKRERSPMQDMLEPEDLFNPRN